MENLPRGYPFRIAITGPESTGKSTLAAGLSRHYRCSMVPEFARAWLQEQPAGYRYTKDDILGIARNQLMQEDRIAAAEPFCIFADTELLVCKIWSGFVFQSCHPWIEENWLSREYDLILLMNVDLPWEHDPLREHPLHREELFERYLSALREQGRNFRIISGKHEERLQNAVLATDMFFSGSPVKKRP